MFRYPASLLLSFCLLPLTAQTGGGSSDFSVFSLDRAAEHRSRPSWGDNGGGTNAWRNRHVLALTFVRVGGEGVQGGGTVIQADIGVRVGTGELGQINANTSPQPGQQTWPLTPDPNGPTANFWVYTNVQQGTQIPVHHASAIAESPLASGHVVVMVRKVVEFHQNVAYTEIFFEKIEYDVHKGVCQDASIDTRMAYGQPNIDGTIPNDPNQGLRDVKFGAWIFRGGLFAGNMPFVPTQDQSGRARIQLGGPAGEATAGPRHRFSVLSMLYLGRPESAAENLTLGAYWPNVTDRNLSVSEQDVTWSTRWLTIDPRGDAGPPGSPDYSHVPLSTVTFSSHAQSDSPILEYYTWQLKPSWAAPDYDRFKVCIAVPSEPDELIGWRYFASREYQAMYSQFPRNDSAPRLWVIYASLLQAWRQ